jgi:hypothetical protein
LSPNFIPVFGVCGSITLHPTTGLPGKENHISATFVQLFTIRYGIIPAYVRRCVVGTFFEIPFALPGIGPHHDRPLRLSNIRGLHVERLSDRDLMLVFYIHSAILD